MAETIYVVIDIRTTTDSDGGAAVVTNFTQHRTRIKAEARYHSALASAANNEQYPCIAAIMLTNDGFVLASQSYTHEVQPEGEPEVTEGE